MQIKIEIPEVFRKLILVVLYLGLTLIVFLVLGFVVRELPKTLS